jgi:DNA-binding Lrp family transcriptional regulator
MLLCLPGDVKKLAGFGLPMERDSQGSNRMKSNDLYTTAHLFVAAVRVLDHQDGAPPALETLCRLLNYSEEKGSYLLNRLKDLGIIDTVKSGFNDRIVVGNHLAIEELPRDIEESRLEQELKKFKKGKDAMQEKVATIKAQQDQKKQDLFAEIEKKLKQKMEKK